MEFRSQIPNLLYKINDIMLLQIKKLFMKQYIHLYIPILIIFPVNHVKTEKLVPISMDINVAAC